MNREWDMGGKYKQGMRPWTEIRAIIKDRVRTERTKSHKKELQPDIIKSRKKDKTEYYNIPCSFDIETTSWYDQGEKRACMYVWMFGINGAVVYGRTWGEYLDMIAIIEEELHLCKDLQLVVYVHNLAYEFQFLRKWESWSKVFAIAPLKPVRATTEGGIQYRCSYILTNKSLEKVGEDLLYYKVEKLSGALDYDKKRGPETYLSPLELNYCENDVRVVMSLIQEKIEQDGNIDRIQLTSTGYVRDYCRKACSGYGIADNKERTKTYWEYRRLMERLTMQPEEYAQLKRVFQGGFTHANAHYVRETLQDVGSFDFTSSYPAVMVLEKFPMSRPQLVYPKSIAESEKYMQLYCCMFDVEFVGLSLKNDIDAPLSKSRCIVKEGVVDDNGRVFSAARVVTTITEQDYFTFKEFYRWDKIAIRNFRVFRRDYLPKPFVMSILKLYQDKTSLKGVSERVVDYMLAKALLNACYGMTVTDPLRDEQVYALDEWQDAKTPDTEDAMENYNTSKTRFLYYPWGVWVTAYARRNLFTGIAAAGNNYVYADTDSVKIILENGNIPEHFQQYVNDYEKRTRAKIQMAAEYHGIDPALFAPCTIKGKQKVIGLWDFEGVYKRFKTLGAKRYLIEEDGAMNISSDGYVDSAKALLSSEQYQETNKGISIDYAITVSGLRKELTTPWIMNQGEPFDIFDMNLAVPPEYTGKRTHTYIDDEIAGTFEDYMGTMCNYHEMSYIHLEAAPYGLSLTDEFMELIDVIQYKGKKYEEVT